MMKHKRNIDWLDAAVVIGMSAAVILALVFWGYLLTRVGELLYLIVQRLLVGFGIHLTREQVGGLFLVIWFACIIVRPTRRQE